MKKAIVILALLLLFGALGGDGYYLLQYGLPGGYEPPQPAPPPMQTEMPVHAKNSIRPTDDMIWRGEVMDLTRLDDRRPAIGD